MDITYQSIVGKTILAGFGIVDENRKELSRMQFHGVIIAADATKGISVRINGAPDISPLHVNNGVVVLPPDLRIIQPAPPGTYRLASTGEEVTDPDYLSSFTVRPHH
jgi:hypothetical protein